MQVHAINALHVARYHKIFLACMHAFINWEDYAISKLNCLSGHITSVTFQIIENGQAYHILVCMQPTLEFWLGLDYIHRLTNGTRSEFCIDLKD